MHYGSHPKWAELDAQATTLSLLLRLTEVHGPLILEPLAAGGGLLALVQTLHHRPPPRVALLAARLLCAPLSTRVSGLANQWREWMVQRGLACVRLALNALPADEALFAGLVSVLLRCSAEEADTSTNPFIHTPQLVPALFAACARAPLELQARQLERFALWLRLCPANCEALTATASLWQPHAAAILAAALDAHNGALTSDTPATGADTAGAATLCGTYMVELLCTYAIEVLAVELSSSSSGSSSSTAGPPQVAREASAGATSCNGSGGSWRALDVALVVTQGCGDTAQVQRARRMLLHRLLASMVRLGPRFGQEAAVAAPKLLRLCVVVRAHLYTPPPPPPPVRAHLIVIPGEGVTTTAVRLAMTTRAPYDASTLTAEHRWEAMRQRCGEDAASGDAQLLLQLFETFDALTVRAMMDDAADAAMRKRTSTETFARMSSVQPHSTPNGRGLQNAAESLVGNLQSLQQGLAGRLRGRGSSSNAAVGLPTPQLLAEATIVVEGGGLAGGSEADVGSGSPSSSSNGGANGLDALLSAPLSVFDILLELLLLLAAAREACLGQPHAGKARAATSQRLREVLWRDLEQGCTWAHLSSVQEAHKQGPNMSDDQHWHARRAHVFNLIVSLGVPLRDHALALRAGTTTTYHAALAETLAPLLQGVLRTFRHFLARDLAPMTVGGGDTPAALTSAIERGAAYNRGAAGYGQLTVLIGQLSGVEAPAWMQDQQTDAHAFVTTALPQWSPLLDSSPLLAAARAAKAHQRSDAVHAVLTANAWSDAALSGWVAAAAEEESVSSSAVAAAEGALMRLRHAESARAAAADAREKSDAAHASQTWEKVQRTLLREQAAWEEPGSSGGSRFWEHLEVEEAWDAATLFQGGRRRPLLVPNPAGSDHRDASAIQQQSGGSRPWLRGVPTADATTADGEGLDEGEGSVAALRRVASLARAASTGVGGSMGDGTEGEEDEEDDELPSPPPQTPGLAKVESLLESSVAGERSSPMSPTGSGWVVGGEGGDGEEGWDASTLFQGSAELVWRGGVVPGVVMLSRTALKFEVAAVNANASTEESAMSGSGVGGGSSAPMGLVAEATGSGSGAPVVESSRMWAVTELRQMQKRRYLLTHTAIEIFTAQPAAPGLPPQASFPGVPLFLHLHTRKLRERFRRALKRVGVPERSWQQTRQALLDAWHRREISNFDYLMELNTLSGRSYNDLNQYPVFPWILSDYTSVSLDLSDVASYRDLAKPVGALNSERLTQFVERYNGMEEDGEMPRFHYGSHYSSAAATLFWLLRLEPYTAYAIELQSGKFDHADRLFYSIAEAWTSCNTSLADVKELLPEFFYCSDFLRNASRFQLGVRQDDKKVDDVVLPPWAATPEAFVAYHRRALESEIVSANLHQWIDLIWGVKQQGAAAEQASSKSLPLFTAPVAPRFPLPHSALP